MPDMRSLYGRLDRWTRKLSRGEYAVFAGVVSLVSYLLVGGVVFGELPVLSAVAMGVTLGAVFYVMRPRIQ